NAIRATGDTITPSAIMVVAIVINLTLDPMLIFGIKPFPRLELAGAALATVIARAVTLVVSLLVLTCREKMLTFKVPKPKDVFNSWKQILYVGLPAAGTNMIIPVSIGIITRLVSSYGSESVAGFGVASRIEHFALTLVMALSTVLIPFVGQNFGAGKHARIQMGVKYSQIFAMLWGAFIFILLIISARMIAGIFNKNPAVISSIVLYLIIVSISYGAHGVFLLTASTFNALNKPLPASGLSILRMFILYIPFALLGSRLFGLR
ncbi:unnamed protein product, partial [marine sediment metagenome]